MARLDEMLVAARGGPKIDKAEPVAPAVYVVAVDGFDELLALDRGGTEAAMAEIAHRLDRLVRAGDVLGRVAPDRFVLLVPSLSPSVAGSLTERICGAVAMPIELGGSAVSLAVTVGFAFSARGAAGTRGVLAEQLVATAEADVERQRARRHR